MNASEARGTRAARVAHVVTLVILLATAIVTLAGPREQWPDPLFAGVLILLVVAGYGTLGRLIVTRAGNVLGWVFLGMGVAAGLTLLAGAYVDVAFQVPDEPSLPGTGAAGWIANLGPVLLALGIPMLFLLFPTGSPPSPRWRWVGWAWLIGGSLATLWLALRPGEVYGQPHRFTIDNPIGLGLVGSLRPLLMVAGTACVLIAALASIVSLVVRFRRARGEERQQIKWLMLVGLAALILFLLLGVVGNGGVEDTMWLLLVLVLLVGIPAATALAIFRYRLYDVDVVISKTIVYTGLALFITVAYVAIVVGVGALFGSGGSDATLQIVATAAVAVAFQPARQRIQHVANRLVYGRRATPYEVMASFGHRMAEVPNADDVLSDMAETAAHGVAATAARVTLELGDGTERSVTWPPDEPVDEPTFALPVGHSGERIGEIAIVKRANEPLRPAERTLLEDLAGNAGPALHNVLLASDLEAKASELALQTEEIERSRERLVTARDAQRRRLERELRDGVGNQLAEIRDEIGSDAERVEAEPEVVERSLDDLGGRANAALEELRDVARGIFPPLLIDKGLAAALDALARKSGPQTRVAVDPRVARTRFDPAAENAVYFCCFQAVQNAQRHAPGSNVAIELSPDGDALVFVVRDDGSGFDPAAAKAGEGMQILTDRVAALGGSITVDSAPGRGTTVTGRVPARALEGATS